MGGRRVRRWASSRALKFVLLAGGAIVWWLLSGQGHAQADTPDVRPANPVAGVLHAATKTVHRTVHRTVDTVNDVVTKPVVKPVIKPVIKPVTKTVDDVVAKTTKTVTDTVDRATETVTATVKNPVVTRTLTAVNRTVHATATTLDRTVHAATDTVRTTVRHADRVVDEVTKPVTDPASARPEPTRSTAPRHAVSQPRVALQAAPRATPTHAPRAAKPHVVVESTQDAQPVTVRGAVAEPAPAASRRTHVERIDAHAHAGVEHPAPTAPAKSPGPQGDLGSSTGSSSGGARHDAPVGLAAARPRTQNSTPTVSSRRDESWALLTRATLVTVRPG